MSLLDRLMAKPVPQAAPHVTIGIKPDVTATESAVKLDIPIVNLTKQGSRSDILKRFQKPIEVTKKQVEDDVKPEELVVDAPDVEVPVTRVTKPARKVGKKLKLIEEPEKEKSTQDEPKPVRKPRRQIKGIADEGPLSMLKIG